MWLFKVSSHISSSSILEEQSWNISNEVNTDYTSLHSSLLYCHCVYTTFRVMCHQLIMMSDTWLHCELSYSMIPVIIYSNKTELNNHGILRGHVPWFHYHVHNILNSPFSFYLANNHILCSYKHCFPSAIRIWNSLPFNVVKASTL